MTESRGEAPRAVVGGTEPSMAGRGTESPVFIERLMEEVCDSENLLTAYRRVQGNKGSPGMDGMTVTDLGDHLKEHRPRIREQLLSGIYQPQPVRRVEIPKPGGGVRKLGIPTVVDRFIQQAVMQVLQRQWDGTFSEHRYGFRPRRSAHQAVVQAQEYIAQGYRWVVDIDLEKFFDRVNHDVLMSRVARRVKDKRVLKLIRAFLNAGVMENGLVSPTDEGRRGLGSGWLQGAGPPDYRTRGVIGGRGETSERPGRIVECRLSIVDCRIKARGEEGNYELRITSRNAGAARGGSGR